MVYAQFPFRLTFFTLLWNLEFNLWNLEFNLKYKNQEIEVQKSRYVLNFLIFVLPIP